MEQKAYQVSFYKQEATYKDGHMINCSLCILAGLQIVFGENNAKKIVDAVNAKGNFTADYKELN